MNFSERLALLMGEKGLSNLKLSKSIGVSDRLIGAWKREETGLALNSAIKLADFFDISLDYLSGRSDVREIASEGPTLKISDNGQQMLNLFEQLDADQQYKEIGRLSVLVEQKMEKDKNESK